MLHFSLLGIEIEYFKVDDEFKLPEQPDIEVSIAPGFGVGTIDNNSIACRIAHKYILNDRPFVSTEILGTFGIDLTDWKDLLDTEKNLITIPKDFALYICSIITGVLRGVLLARLENTNYSKLFLPLVNPSELFAIDEDIVMKFAKSEK